MRKSILPTNGSCSYLHYFQGREILEDTHRQGGEVVVTEGSFLCFVLDVDGRRRGGAEITYQAPITSSYHNTQPAARHGLPTKVHRQRSTESSPPRDNLGTIPIEKSTEPMTNHSQYTQLPLASSVRPHFPLRTLRGEMDKTNTPGAFSKAMGGGLCTQTKSSRGVSSSGGQTRKLWCFALFVLYSKFASHTSEHMSGLNGVHPQRPNQRCPEGIGGHDQRITPVGVLKCRRGGGGCV